MAEFVKIGSVAELPGENEAKEFECAGKTICVARVNGEISAMDNVCVHRGGPLGQGVVMDGKIICPWHGWQFDPKTGKTLMGRDMGVPVYRIKIEGDEVFVELG
jgi:nitrite reductase (NADH) small subunit